MNRFWNNGGPVLLIACFAMFVSPVVPSVQISTPRFEDYPVRKVFKGVPASPRIVSRQARRYRTVIRDYGKGPPNFAGHYRVVDIGCGADCKFIFVVDVITGEVYYPDIHLNFDSYFLLDKEEGRALRQYYPQQFRAESRLLVTIGTSETLGRGLFFYEWKGNQFKLIRRLIGKD